MLTTLMFLTTIIFFLPFIFYILFSWFLLMIARKKAQNTEVGAIQFFIPFYRYYRLIEIYELPKALFFGLCAFTIVSIITIPYTYRSFLYMLSTYNFGLGLGISGKILFLAYCVSAASLAYLWGKIAEIMGDKFWPWAVAGFFAHSTFIVSFLIPMIFAYGNFSPYGSFMHKDAEENDTGPKEGKMRLACLMGACAGQEAVGEAGRVVVIGRAVESDFVIASPEISRKHAVITFGSDGQAKLEDFSKNGVFRIAGGAKTKINGKANIKRGDVFELGNPAVRFQLR